MSNYINFRIDSDLYNKFKQFPEKDKDLVNKKILEFIDSLSNKTDKEVDEKYSVYKKNSNNRISVCYYFKIEDDAKQKYDSLSKFKKKLIRITMERLINEIDMNKNKSEVVEEVKQFPNNTEEVEEEKIVEEDPMKDIKDPVIEEQEKAFSCFIPENVIEKFNLLNGNEQYTIQDRFENFINKIENMNPEDFKNNNFDTVSLKKEFKFNIKKDLYNKLINYDEFHKNKAIQGLTVLINTEYSISTKRLLDYIKQDNADYDLVLDTIVDRCADDDFYKEADSYFQSHDSQRKKYLSAYLKRFNPVLYNNCMYIMKKKREQDEIQKYKDLINEKNEFTFI